MKRLAVIISIIFGLTVWQFQRWQQLRLVFCDVGQGDAVLITHRNNQLLVDAGPDYLADACLKQELPWWDRTLEVVVATHPDADHIAGFPAVMNHYQVEKIYTTPDYRSTKTFNDFQQAISRGIESHGTTHYQQPVLGQKISLSSRVKGKIYFHPALALADAEKRLPAESLLSAQMSHWQKSSLEVNERSIVLFITLDKVVVGLTGDMGIETEQALATNQMTEKVTILKVGHHGSKSSSGQLFLQRLQPELSVISVGEGNRYQHPHPDVVSRLEEVGSRVLRTDLEGTIAIIIDGNKYQLRRPVFKQLLTGFGLFLLNQRSTDSDTH